MTLLACVNGTGELLEGALGGVRERYHEVGRCSGEEGPEWVDQGIWEEEFEFKEQCLLNMTGTPSWASADPSFARCACAYNAAPRRQRFASCACAFIRAPAPLRTDGEGAE